jgi:hypothetical protein
VDNSATRTVVLPHPRWGPCGLVCRVSDHGRFHPCRDRAHLLPPACRGLYVVAPSHHCMTRATGVSRYVAMGYVSVTTQSLPQNARSAAFCNMRPDPTACRDSGAMVSGAGGGGDGVATSSRHPGIPRNAIAQNGVVSLINTRSRKSLKSILPMLRATCPRQDKGWRRHVNFGG